MDEVVLPAEELRLERLERTDLTLRGMFLGAIDSLKMN